MRERRRRLIYRSLIFFKEEECLFFIVYELTKACKSPLIQRWASLNALILWFWFSWGRHGAFTNVRLYVSFILTWIYHTEKGCNEDVLMSECWVSFFPCCQGFIQKIRTQNADSNTKECAESGETGNNTWKKIVNYSLVRYKELRGQASKGEQQDQQETNWQLNRGTTDFKYA